MGYAVRHTVTEVAAKFVHRPPDTLKFPKHKDLIPKCIYRC